MAATRPPLDVVQGTLDILILKAASWGPRHGYSIGQWITETSGESLQIEPSALYPALHRLEGKGWLEGEWGINHRNQRVKHYTLTAEGRKQLKADAATWARYVSAFDRILTSQG